MLAVPGAAGGPKGLILNPLDRFLFGRWLAGEGAPVHLLGASIGAWRMASACLADADAALAEMAHHYTEESYLDADALERARASGRPVRQPGAESVSRVFRARLSTHLGGRTDELLRHPRFRLHLFTSRGVHPLLRREGRGADAAAIAERVFEEVERDLEEVDYYTPLAYFVSAMDASDQFDALLEPLEEAVRDGMPITWESLAAIAGVLLRRDPSGRHGKALLAEATAHAEALDRRNGNTAASDQMRELWL